MGANIFDLDKKCTLLGKSYHKLKIFILPVSLG